MRPWSIWLGYDPRESDAFAVARESIRRRLNVPLPIYGLVLNDLRKAGLYSRPTQIKVGKWTDANGKKWASTEPVLWDDISQWTMSTEFAISRFLVPHIAGTGLALFTDCDFMARVNLHELFQHIDQQPAKAVWCVKHDHVPSTETKMDGQLQSAYGRKNWSSAMVWDCDHPGAKRFTPDYVNSVPGRDLHQFKVLADDEIGELGPEWNHLVKEMAPNPAAKLVHFTLGIPSMKGHETCEFADEWRAERDAWARGMLSFGS